jgi:hypothetical protein
MSYSQEISRQHPACIMFLVDQSGSMLEPLAGDESVTKCHGVADAINKILLELILKSVKSHDEGPRHFFDIGMIGYGQHVGSVLGGELAGRSLVSIVELTQHPLVADQPRWLEPGAGGPTPMGAAINHAGAVLAEWANQHPESFPPIVINISDGAPTDDPEPWVHRLTSIATQDGNLLLFNLNISRFADPPVMFPARDDQLPNDYARALFHWSSVLPPSMFREAARTRPLETGARGFGYNGDFNALVDFLVTGTQVVREIST